MQGELGDVKDGEQEEWRVRVVLAILLQARGALGRGAAVDCRSRLSRGGLPDPCVGEYGSPLREKRDGQAGPEGPRLHQSIRVMSARGGPQALALEHGRELGDQGGPRAVKRRRGWKVIEGEANLSAGHASARSLDDEREVG